MKVADRNNQRSFFLKITLLANASPAKLIRQPADTSASRLQVLLKYPYIPIDLTLAGDFLTTGWEFHVTR